MQFHSRAPIIYIRTHNISSCRKRFVAVVPMLITLPLLLATVSSRFIMLSVVGWSKIDPKITRHAKRGSLVSFRSYRSQMFSGNVADTALDCEGGAEQTICEFYFIVDSLIVSRVGVFSPIAVVGSQAQFGFRSGRGAGHEDGRTSDGGLSVRLVVDDLFGTANAGWYQRRNGRRSVG